MNGYKVYKHTSPHGKVYIGITSKENPNDRWLNGKGYYKNKHFIDAIIKYGWDSFKHEILFEDLSKEDACYIEQILIKAYNSNDKRFGYNITNGGDYFKHSEESIRKMSANRMGKGTGTRNLSEESRRRMKENHKGGADSKKVICIETSITFESINAAARAVGKNKKMISNCCRNVPHYNTCGGYHWRFVED